MSIYKTELQKIADSLPGHTAIVKKTEAFEYKGHLVEMRQRKVGNMRCWQAVIDGIPKGPNQWTCENAIKEAKEIIDEEIKR